MIPMSINQVKPGLLVSHGYTPEIGVVVRCTWNWVEVLTGDGSIVRWSMGDFRSVYGVAE